MRLTIILIGFLLSALGAGCEIGTTIADVASRSTGSIGSRSFTDPPQWVDRSGPLALDVESFNGDVVVTVTDQIDVPRITVTRRALHGALRSDEMEASLGDIDYSFDVTPGELGPALTVRTWTTHPEGHFQAADLLIEMPEVDGLRVRTTNGDVFATGIQGAVDIVTSDGDVRVMTPRPLIRPVSIINHAGDIDYRVRSESTGAFDCQAIRGDVIKLFNRGRVIIHSGTNQHTLLATLNDGENPVVLRVADGDIRIAVVPAPVQLGTVIVD